MRVGRHAGSGSTHVQHMRSPPAGSGRAVQSGVVVVPAAVTRPYGLPGLEFTTPVAMIGGAAFSAHASGTSTAGHGALGLRPVGRPDRCESRDPRCSPRWCRSGKAAFASRRVRARTRPKIVTCGYLEMFNGRDSGREAGWRAMRTCHGRVMSATTPSARIQSWREDEGAAPVPSTTATCGRCRDSRLRPAWATQTSVGFSQRSIQSRIASAR